ncbi:putative endoglucanase [Aspergillus clavatus NRRL 1]|uniref:Probable xyloglucan-specific endo-beta-1,4-glucanase A n=1 Tax=Aspergillus clavatus (strain ATCC 1007 / CBS 513.65 / DSM 816 / NCTC 3887 / NRRL 1 / QM 1276 / 107) TaxID=344612 RepID=XGEA_ASPCL|nr:endoglucanase, putative [Aspergillus clavatus NRRL 1]A1CRJ0.1 RecName: Full=Probable xyloglucan-specific endo-beta-1,4-glucanase A; AltName: Full=Xyloglucanase A; AltName: Full=Xyloglucanendohydrolase A; Flags: Precursor [Aspergillus clavatus NRRL 1]EAW08261.1 endoglucanase, putative [Aspergillus clavatus NRRL 1]
MKFNLALALSLTVATAEAATELCKQWDSIIEGNFIVYNNLWGQGNADDGGHQCTTVKSISGDTVVWSTEWAWSGGPGQVKSYANAALQFTPTTLSSVSSIDSTWKWRDSYTGSDIVANVAYDMFLSSSATGSEEYEIMVWLAALGGAGPISSTGSPIATPTINGVQWDLYLGPNGAMQVYSFVAPSSTENFAGDMKGFIDYLTSEQGLSKDLYLLDVQAGTEPFSGSDAVLTVSEYSVNLA